MKQAKRQNAKGIIEKTVQLYVEPLMLSREIARCQGDWSIADKIRGALTKLKIDVVDYPEGSAWKLGDEFWREFARRIK